mmetsp:Transcript_36440/g.102723  ORF Transcript_36440/g.102723 Transcript_36440/m.102723 type:complete len:380 (+) Transcript_36440:76-1215(+)
MHVKTNSAVETCSHTGLQPLTTSVFTFTPLAHARCTISPGETNHQKSIDLERYWHVLLDLYQSPLKQLNPAQARRPCCRTCGLCRCRRAMGAMPVMHTVPSARPSGPREARSFGRRYCEHATNLMTSSSLKTGSFSGTSMQNCPPRRMSARAFSTRLFCCSALAPADPGLRPALPGLAPAAQGEGAPEVGDRPKLGARWQLAGTARARGVPRSPASSSAGVQSWSRSAAAQDSSAARQTPRLCAGRAEEPLLPPAGPNGQRKSSSKPGSASDSAPAAAASGAGPGGPGGSGFTPQAAPLARAVGIMVEACACSTHSGSPGPRQSSRRSAGSAKGPSGTAAACFGHAANCAAPWAKTGPRTPSSIWIGANVICPDGRRRP